MEEPWTILELAELAADALAAAQPTGQSAEAGPPAEARAGSSGGGETPPGGGGTPSGAAPVRANGRVRDVPNERLVRWYVTVGLVDPPLSRRGRVARYGRRHLLQLVAVKRRQAEGRSLAEIQAELAGATDQTLAAVARLTDASPAPQAPLAAPDKERPGQTGPAGLVYGIRLAPGVTVLLEGADREPGPDDLTEIANAAEPLLRELASRGFRAFGPGHPSDVVGRSPGAGQPAEESKHDH